MRGQNIREEAAVVARGLAQSEAPRQAQAVEQAGAERGGAVEQAQWKRIPEEGFERPPLEGEEQAGCGLAIGLPSLPLFR